MSKKVVIALGGNALEKKGMPATAESQLEVCKETSKHIVEILKNGYDVIIAHGNGPQVGRIILASEEASKVTPAMPFDVCGAMSQAYIGYHIQQAMNEQMKKEGVNLQAATVVTQVLVDQNDPAFQNPSKPIGPFYSEEEGNAIAKEKGYTIKADAGRGYRRVVASPKPKKIIELEAVKLLADNGFVPITVGGGGIPVIDDGGIIKGTAAVIDKDLASEKLAEDLNADVLLVLTEVETVKLNFGKPDEKSLNKITTAEAEQYIGEGHFAPGSMLPKVQAAVAFAKSASGRMAVITSLEKATEALKGQTGTTIDM